MAPPLPGSEIYRSFRQMEISKIIVRQAIANDIDSIIQFNMEMAYETEKITLSKHILRKGVSAVFEDSAKGFYIVAECDNRVVGQAMITYEWSDWRNGIFWWIQSVYVIPGYRRAGVFRSIFNQIKTMAEKSSNICGLRLYVDKYNAIAKSVYESLGMKASHYDLYES